MALTQNFNMIKNFLCDGRVLSLVPGDVESQERLAIFAANSMTLIVGNNGAGKTRTLRALANAILSVDEQIVDPIGIAQKTAVIHYSADPFDLDKSQASDRYFNIAPTRKSERVYFDFETLKDVGSVFNVQPERILELSSTSNTINDIVAALTYRHNSVSWWFDLVDEIKKPVDIYIEKHELAMQERPHQSFHNWIESLPYQARELAKINLIDAIARYMGKNQPFYLSLLAIKATLRDHSQKLVLPALLAEFGIVARVSKQQAKARKTMKGHIENLKKIANILDVTDLSEGEYVLDDKKVSGLRKIGISSYGMFSTSGLSSGNAALIEQFSEIRKRFKTIFRNESIENVMLLIDEGDAFLHIGWQQKYVKFLNEFIKKIRQSKDISVQVVLTTHSPVLMSDFPRDCVVKLTATKDNDDLEKGREVISFGATLQSIIYKTGGAGTIGDFSSEFIRKLINKIETGLPINSSQIDMIDDDVIRNALYVLLDQRESRAS